MTATLTSRERAFDLTRAEDAALIRAIGATKDRGAFDELYRRYQAIAFGLLLQIVHDQVRAEDALQEAFLCVWRFSANYRDENRARSWLLRIVAHEGLRILRTRRRADRKIIGDSDQALAAAPARTERIPDKELVQALNSQLESLEPDIRQVVSLYYMAGLSQQEIGKALDLTQQAISTKIKEGLDRLRRGLIRAGFAAALPILESGNWENLIRTDLCPDDTSKATLDKRLDLVGQPARASRRMVPSAVGSTALWIAGVATLAIVAVSIWRVALPDHQAAPAAPMVSSSAVPPAPTKARAYFYRKFEFTQPAPGNVFEQIDGKWHFVPGTGADDPGGMKTEGKTANIRFHLPLLHAPLRVTVRARLAGSTTPEGGYLLALGYSKLEAGAFLRNTAKAYKTVYDKMDQWIDYTFYVTPDFVDCFIEGRRTLLLFLRPDPGADFDLFLRNEHLIRSIEVEELESSAIDDHTDFLAAIQAIPRSQWTGTHPLPAKFQIPGNKAPYLEFYQSADRNPAASHALPENR